jgi:hypothetical protein
MNTSACEKQNKGKLISSNSFFIGLNFIKGIEYFQKNKPPFLGAVHR